ncbi:FCD domain-containing protein [Paracoccus onubensis]|uniref:FadR/GntR family transcriptional regulator n=1 Tax=Paracoccus onubensis TaxID=1675788 RepID=UPI00273149E6|nr:FCD domain-containing protein [Paracoccus onubensis]MDP0926406.1 FCD domain-containing protein [Paracoccus onubensis]
MSGTTIKSTKAAESVARHIETLIIEGTLRPGEALLPERELAKRLNVSRPTLRDGLKALQDRGLLRQEGNRGLRVAALGAGAITDPLLELLAGREELADDYLEFRDIVECQAAALAAERANEVDLRRIRACLDRIDRAFATAEPDEEAEADAELHQLIYEASHNLVLLQIMRALSGGLRRDVIQNRGRMFTLPHTRDRLREQHHAIASAIIAGKQDAAHDAAHQHLGYVRESLHRLRDSEAKLAVSNRRDTGGGLTG